VSKTIKNRQQYCKKLKMDISGFTLMKYHSTGKKHQESMGTLLRSMAQQLLLSKYCATTAEK